MKYIIHSYASFDTAEYIISSLRDTKISIKLSNSAGRILEELIKYRNTGTPVTREHLFTVVWKTYGLSPSHGNLNQQISLIRKTLTKVGLTASSIITIPKRGLKLNNQLIIEGIQDDSIKPQSIHNQKIHYNNNTDDHSIILSIKTYAKYIISISVICFIMFSIGFLYLYNKTDNIKLYCCKEINSCSICSFPIISEFECNDCSMLYFEVI